MHAVFHRGRSMPRDHQTFRGFLVWIGVLSSTLSTGCLRSTILRQRRWAGVSAGFGERRPSKSGRASSSSPPGMPTPGGPANSAMAASTPAASAPSARPAPPAELQGAPTHPFRIKAALEPSMPPPWPSANPPAAALRQKNHQPTSPCPPCSTPQSGSELRPTTRRAGQVLEPSPPDFDPESIAAKLVASGSPTVVRFHSPASRIASLFASDYRRDRPPKSPGGDQSYRRRRSALKSKHSNGCVAANSHRHQAERTPRCPSRSRTAHSGITRDPPEQSGTDR